MGIPFVRHPLYCGMDFGEFPTPVKGGGLKVMTLEEVVARKLEFMPKKEDNPLSWVFFHERPFRLNALLETEYTGEMVGSVYIDAEWPLGKTWRPLFEQFTPEELMDEDDLKVWNELPEEFTIFQGDTGDPWEISWTLKRSVAEWFANRFSGTAQGGNGEVREKRIKKSEARAYFGGRNEEEIIHWGW